MHIHYINTDMNNSKLFKKTDLILIAALLFAAALFALPQFFGKSGERVAVITVDNKVIAQIPLDKAENQTLNINNTVIEINNGEIYFAESDCRDKICVRSGKLSEKGESAACLPNRVAISIKSPDGNVDAVVY